MRRIMICLLALLLALSPAALGAESAVLTVECAEPEENESSIVLNVTLENGAGCCGGSFILWYDGACLELTGLEAGPAVNGAVTAVNPSLGDGVAKMSWVSTSRLAEDGVVARLTFRLLLRENTTVELLNPELLDQTGAAMPLRAVNGQVTFPGVSQSPPESLPDSAGNSVVPPGPSSGSAPSGGGDGGTSAPSAPTEGMPAAWVNPFQDVPEDAWFYGAVAFVSQHGLFYGTSDHTFSPALTMDRAMLASVLCRMEEGTAAANILDVFDDRDDVADWAVPGLAWTVDRGILQGDGRLLMPQGSLTREMLAVMLFRLHGAPSADKTVLEAFSDQRDISPWALDAMAWMVGCGLMEGRGQNLLCPTDTATRAEVAAIFARMPDGIQA